MLIDQFLEDATEVDVDALCDGDGCADRRDHGAHRGSGRAFGRQFVRAAAVIAFETECSTTIERYTKQLALALNVIGLMNVQYAIKDGTVYVLEVNPRASRTVPFVSKATGVPLPKIAVGLMLGKKLSRFRVSDRRITDGVLPVSQVLREDRRYFRSTNFPAWIRRLGPEMRSTGEVMGVGENFGEAFAKAQLAAGTPIARTKARCSSA